MLSLAPLPIESILFDLQKSIETKLYYPALLVALTLPEICMALSLDRNTFVKEKHYVAFLEKYAPEGVGLSPVDCYRLRGGVVHRADFRGHTNFPATHVIFTTPESNIGIHALHIQSGDKAALMLDLKSFTNSMTEAVRRWARDHRDDAVVAANVKNLIRSLPQGLPPFVVGFPVVASGE